MERHPLEGVKRASGKVVNSRLPCRMWGRGLRLSRQTAAWTSKQGVPHCNRHGRKRVTACFHAHLQDQRETLTIRRRGTSLATLRYRHRRQSDRHPGRARQRRPAGHAWGRLRRAWQRAQSTGCSLACRHRQHPATRLRVSASTTGAEPLYIMGSEAPSLGRWAQ